MGASLPAAAPSPGRGAWGCGAGSRLPAVNTRALTRLVLTAPEHHEHPAPCLFIAPHLSSPRNRGDGASRSARGLGSLVAGDASFQGRDHRIGTRALEVSPWVGSQLVPPLWSPDSPRHLGAGAEPALSSSRQAPGSSLGITVEGVGTDNVWKLGPHPQSFCICGSALWPEHQGIFNFLRDSADRNIRGQGDRTCGSAQALSTFESQFSSLHSKQLGLRNPQFTCLP